MSRTQVDPKILAQWNRAYLTGRDRIWGGLRNKPQKNYFYSDDIAVNNGSSARLDIPVQADAHFLVEEIQIITSLQTVSDDLFTVQFSDSTYSQTWSNVAVPLRDATGRGDNVGPLPYPNIVAPTGTITALITNNSGSNAQVYVSYHGRKIYNINAEERAFLMRRMWYQYVMAIPQLTAGQVGVKATVQLFNESDFLLKSMASWEMLKQIFTATAGAESAEVMMQLRDTTNDRSLFSKKTAFRLAVGAERSLQQNGATWYTNGDEFRLTLPEFFRRNGLIEGEFDNRANSTIATSRLILEGARVFDGH